MAGEWWNPFDGWKPLASGLWDANKKYNPWVNQSEFVAGAGPAPIPMPLSILPWANRGNDIDRSGPIAKGTSDFSGLFPPKPQGSQHDQNAGLDGFKQLMAMFGAGGGGGSTSTSTTTQSGAAVPNFGPALAALRKQLADARDQASSDRASIEAKGARVATQLANDYANSATSSKADTKASNANVDKAAGTSKENYNQALADYAALNATSGEGSMLSPEEAASAQSSDGLGDVLNQLLVTRQQDAQNSFLSRKGDNDSLLTDMLAQNARGKADGVADAKDHTTDLVSDRRKEFRAESNSLNQQLTSLLAQQAAAQAAAAPRTSTTVQRSSGGGADGPSLSALTTLADKLGIFTGAGASGKEGKQQAPFEQYGAGLAADPRNQILLGEIINGFVSNTDPNLFNQTSKGDLPKAMNWFNQQVQGAGGWPGGAGDVTSAEATQMLTNLIKALGGQAQYSGQGMYPQAG